MSQYAFDHVRFRQLRHERGFSQRRLAIAMGRKPAFVSHLENGRNNPSIESLAAAADALEVSMEMLMTRVN